MKLLRRLGLIVAVLATGAFVAPSSPAGAAGCARAAGEVPVAVVVDFGTVPGSPSGVSQVCVPVADRTNGAVLLSARAQLLQVAAPRWDSSGLLCAIDGYPETGCGETSNGVHKYWSYWLGDGSGWSYAPIGPAAHRVDANVAEGWRFVEGTDEGAKPPPRGPSVSTAVCQQITPGTTSTSTGGNGSLSGTGTGSSTAGSTGTNGTAGGEASTTGGTTGPTEETIPNDQVVTLPSLPTASTTTTTLPGATTTAPKPSTKTVIGSTEAERKRAAQPAQRILSASTEKDESGGIGGFVGPVAIVAVLAVLVAGGIWQARRRRAG